MALSPLNQRRWRNFQAQPRALWSFGSFLGVVYVSLFAEFIANDKPILVSYRGEYLRADVQILSRDAVRRGFPDRGGLFRSRGAVLDPTGG